MNKSEKIMPQEIDAKVAFRDISHLMPAYDEIPEEFKGVYSKNKFVKWAAKWFFQGLKKEEIPEAKEGIDKNKALRHLAVIQRSFAPKHEHKGAAVAYLASLWFEEPNI